MIFDYGASDETGKGEQKTPKFKGLLSIGVDESSNTLIVSAPAFLFDRVREMIEKLDRAAGDNVVEVVKVGPGITRGSSAKGARQRAAPRLVARGNCYKTAGAAARPATGEK